MNQEETLARAEAALKRGDGIGAEGAIMQAWRDLSKAPGDALHALALARSLQNKPADAEKFMREAIRVEPNSLRHHIALGHIRASADNNAGAADAYAAAARIDPKWPGLLLVLSRACYHAGRLDEAERAARQALQDAPSPDTWDALSCALRGQAKGEEALQAANEALRTDPQHFNALNSRGAALLMVGRPKDALDAFDVLAARGIDVPVLVLNRGAALEALGRQAEARALYQDAARRWPHLPNLQERLRAKR